METANSFLTETRVEPVVTTTVARNYLVTISADAPTPAPRATRVESFRGKVSSACFEAAVALERVLVQLGAQPSRTLPSRPGGIAFVFLRGARYAMLECDDEATIIAMLSDRSRDEEAETWIVDPDGLTSAVRKVRSFLGAAR